MKRIRSSNSGYPRLGEKREWKFALEKFWSREWNQETFVEETKKLRLAGLKKQKEKGIDLIPVGDWSFYDQVLDLSLDLGIVPERFKDIEDPLEQYYDIARGNTKAIASGMSKWFNTNYHYIVPEFEGQEPSKKQNRLVQHYLEAKTNLDIDGKPVLLGALTYVKLAKGYAESEFRNWLVKLLPLYQEIVKEIEVAGAKWIQIDEPYLVTDGASDILEDYHWFYTELKKSISTLKIELNTYFGALTDYKATVNLPVDAIALDLVHDSGENWDALEKQGFPKDKSLFAGIIDGRNIWITDLKEKEALIQKLLTYVDADRLWIQPSNSLLHVPITKKQEKALLAIILDNLAFADEKLDELGVLVKRIANEGAEQDVFNQNQDALSRIYASAERNDASVKAEVLARAGKDWKRKPDFETRKQIQEKKFNLPILPTTTIGSFPQSKRVRKIRLAYKKGELGEAEYQDFIENEIKHWIKAQEDIDLDVLVHGEFERTDMVEYFGNTLTGFEVTSLGWVQSYGSRAVKPPIIWADIAFTEPITVKESVYAQSLTERPVKGMITAPLTIVNWSFVRDDIPRFEVLQQLALALKKEVLELESAGIRIIQVDEPALKEGLPLKKKYWAEYLKHAVQSFWITTSSVAPQTQIHTHMCYSQFDDIIQTIEDLDADVISIETSKSHGELIDAFDKTTYKKGIGLGVYDIHSPRVPSLQEVEKNILQSLHAIDIKQFWINPDCGLKTRKEKETIEALGVMVKAAQKVRTQFEE